MYLSYLIVLIEKTACFHLLRGGPLSQGGPSLARFTLVPVSLPATLHGSSEAIGGVLIGRVVIAIFSAMRWLHHPFLCLLGSWFLIWHRKFLIRKNDRTGHLQFWNFSGGPKNQNLIIFTKRGHRLQMTRGFQIWAQNLNRTTFDPFLAKKRPETGFCQFSTVFFCQKGIKCCSI